MADEQHWSEGFEHESLAEPQAREAFTKAMSKYESPEAAVMGGYNAIKEVGKPYKLPESLDKLPDDKIRQEFQAGLGKLLGAVEKPEDLKDIKWLDGSKQEKPDEGLVTSFSKFAAENKIPKSLAQKLVSFHNSLMTQELQAYEQTKAQKNKEVNEYLLKSYNGSADALKADVELMKRMFLHHAGLTPDEYEQAGEEVFNSLITQSPILAKAILGLAKNFKEGVSSSGDGTPPPPPPQPPPKDLPNTRKALGWE
jgi:hypothetical protein